MKRLFIAGAVALCTLAASGSGPAHAGDPGGYLEINVDVYGGPDPWAAAAATTPVVSDPGGAPVNCDPAGPPGPVPSVQQFCYEPELINNVTYTLSLDGLPDEYYIASASCTNSSSGTTEGLSFVQVSSHVTECTIQVEEVPLAYFDLTVNNDDGGSAVPGDFDIEIYDTDGGEITATANDADPDRCFFDGFPSAACVEIPLVPGQYFMGASAMPGYVATSVGCRTVEPAEQFPAAQGVFTQPDGTVLMFCQITMTYVEQVITADIVIENDDGGTATGDQFTIEIYDDGGLVAEGVDPAPNDPSTSFVSDPLPIGNYTFGVRGPDGYETSVEIVIVEIEIVDERLPGATADFTLSREETVRATLTANDPLQAPTTTAAPDTTAAPTTAAPTSAAPTTAAPTSAAPTTAAPTTAAPTTAAPATTVAPTTQLPATGTATPTVLLWALAIASMGTGTVLLTRRS